MRGSLGGALALAVLLLAGFDVAPLMAKEGKPGAAPPPPAKSEGAPATPAATPDSQPIRSSLGGFSFLDRPFPLRDDGTLSNVAGMVAREQGRTCEAGEAFGWEASASDQKRVDGLHDSVSNALRQVGYKLTPYTPRAVRSDDVVIYNADKVGGRLLVLWVLSPAPHPEAKTQLVLILCKAGKAG